MKVNNLKKYDIVLLTSYPKLDEKVKEYFKELSPQYGVATTRYKAYYDSDEDIIANIPEQVRVIISRGYPATVCKRLTNKYVVEISVTFQDVINAINKVIDSEVKKVAVIAYSNIVNEKNNIVKLGDLEIYFYILGDRKKDRENILNYVEDKKIDRVVGSALVYETLKDSKIPCVMIESSLESIGKAVEEAVLFVDNERELNRKKNLERKDNIQKGWVAKYIFNDILCKSRVFKTTKSLAKRYAKSSRTVLIVGETGTGKELLAQSIHNESNRFDRPFISINCGEIPESLIGSELFGYTHGAFTGASKYGKKGLLALSNGGTLFLDEIGEASLSLQTNLLRVIEERKIRSVGDNKLEEIDFRIICATNKDLKQLIEEKKFREDLYYRLNELYLEVPPLRDRGEDIYLLAKYFTLKEYHNEYREHIKIDERIFNVLSQYHWPGNIRELRNFILKLVFFSGGSKIDENLVKDFFSLTFDKKIHNSADYIEIPIKKDMSGMEREIFRKLLAYYKGDKERLCKDYDISRTTLWRKLNSR